MFIKINNMRSKYSFINKPAFSTETQSNVLPTSQRLSCVTKFLR